MLTKKQKAALHKKLSPILSDLMEGGVNKEIQRRVKEALGDATEDRDSFQSKIFNRRQRDFLEEGKDQGYGVTRLIRCLGLAKGDVDKAVKICQKEYKDDLGDIVAKALSSGDEDQGGVFVPQNLANSFIDALRAKAVVRAAGPVTVDLTGGNLRVPRVVTDASAGWVGENRNRSASNVRTGSLNFTAKTLQGKASTTLKLLRRSGQNAETIFRQNLIKVMANAEDTAFLSGQGTDATPKGMLNWAASANKFNSAGTSLANVQTDMRLLLSKLTDNNVDIDKATYFLSSRSRNYMAFEVRDKEDTPVFKNGLIAASPTINGQPAFTTNNISNTLGNGTYSRVYLADMMSAWLAEEGGMTIRITTDGSFTDESGSTVSAFDYGLMAIIMEREVDFAMSHDVAVAVLQQVTYGV